MGARRLSRRRWLLAALVAGVVAAAVVAAAAAGDAGAERADALRRDAASLLLLGGLIVAIGLGSAAFNRDGDSGHLGLLAASGAGRRPVAAGVLAARVLALAAVVAAWGLALQAASLALGRGLDGPLAVHTLAALEGLVLALLAAAAAGTVVAPVAAGAAGLAVHVLAQATVNLKAAADQGLIGTAADAVRALFYLGPRAVTSPMISDLQAREAAGPAAPPLEINQNTVHVPPAGPGTVGWTLAWCLLLAVLCAAGLRRRPLA